MFFSISVRSFILTHLQNLQQTSAPHKQHLRYNLTDVMIPRDYDVDFRKYSRNMDLSYFTSSLGVGAGVESNIIYVPGSFIPRSIDFNLTTALQGVTTNIGEIGARLEGLEPIVEEVFGPEGYLQRATFGQILNDMTSFAEEKGRMILEHFQNSLRQRRSIDSSTLSNLFSTMYGNERSKVQADVFARFMGQEITFASVAGDFKKLNAEQIINSFFSYFDEVLSQVERTNLDSIRTGQLDLDYSIPSIQGVPLKLKLQGTAVVGLKMQGNFNLPELLLNWRNGENVMKIIPSLSAEVYGFVGYDCYLTKTGIKMNSTISTTSGVSINVKAKNGKELEFMLDIPEKMELLSVKSETYLMKKVKGRTETKVIPSSVRDTRIKGQSCYNSLESVIGLKVCYDFNVPNILQSNALPLGEPSIAKIYVEKAERSISGYKLSSVLHIDENVQNLQSKLEIVGASTPREVTLVLENTKQQDSYTLQAKVQSSVNAEFWSKIINRENEKSLEAFVQMKTSTVDISKGVKIDFVSKSVTDGKEHDMKLYMGDSRNFSPETEIFESKLILNCRETEFSYDVKMMTKNVLRNYLNLRMECK